MSQPVKFRIDADQIGGRVEVDGEDVTAKLDAAHLRIQANQPTVLMLHLKPGCEGAIEGEGIVEVAVDRPDAEVICEFLAGIDGAALERAAMNGCDASQSPTAVMLDVLQAWARGETWDPI